MYKEPSEWHQTTNGIERARGTGWMRRQCIGWMEFASKSEFVSWLSQTAGSRGQTGQSHMPMSQPRSPTCQSRPCRNVNAYSILTNPLSQADANFCCVIRPPTDLDQVGKSRTRSHSFGFKCQGWLTTLQLKVLVNFCGSYLQLGGRGAAAITAVNTVMHPTVRRSAGK